MKTGRLPAVALCMLIVRLVGAAPLETPEQFAGFRMGTDKKLLRWDRIVEYMRKAQAASPRVKVEELGKTTNGNPFVLVTITSPETMQELPHYRGVQHTLAYPNDLNENDAEPLIDRQKAVLLITCNIHSTEIGSSQMVLELVHRLATENSDFVNHVLNNVIFLLVPSLNPDGQVIVTNWYNNNAGTPYEYSFLPELYHKYTGHDDNRDAFMNTQVESRLINRLTYKDWFPHVFLDEHQMGSTGARIFVPPFKNPINPNIDPLIWEMNGLLGYAMGTALNEKGYPGVINDAMYDSWWQGGFLLQAWWHNMVGLLTEVASANIATPIEQEKAKPGVAARGPELTREQLRDRDPRKPLTPSRDTTSRNTYPRPWLGGKWTLRNIVDYELAATYGLLEGVANNRKLLVRNFYHLNRKQIELGKKEAPYAYVIPREQHDPLVAARMLQILNELGVEMHQSAESFQAGGKTYSAGSHVILMAQPFRAFAKDLLEKQNYPVQRAFSGGPIERPYDVTGWTLPYQNQMGVDALEIAKPFNAKLEKLKSIPVPPGRFESRGNTAAGYEISHETNNSSNRSQPAAESRTRRGLDQWPDFHERLGFGFATQRLEPRVGHRCWLLEQYEFPYFNARDSDVKSGRLSEKFDVVVLPRESKDALMKGMDHEWIRPEHRTALGAEGVAALKQFVRPGGTLITLGTSSLLPIEEFPLPLKNPVFYNDVAFEATAPLGDTAVRAIANNPAAAVLTSGWLGGEEYLQDRIVAAEVKFGKGHVILFGFAVQNRAQPHGTFKLLFNSMHYAASAE